MSLISQVIASPINGISQQPPAYRSPSQGEEMINCDATVAGGLQKRLPTEIVRLLGTETYLKAFVHFIDTGSERYFILCTGVAPVSGPGFVPNIRAFTIFGTEQTVSQNYFQAQYLTTDNPERDLRAITVGDYTVIVNRAITVAKLNPTVSTPYQEVQTFSQLPSPAGPNPVNFYKVVGDQSSGFTPYWVTPGPGLASWVETTMPALSDYINPQTLPLWISRNPSSGTWSFRDYYEAFRLRVVGDMFLSPLPSIVGKKIQDVFFYRNRLGYVTPDTIVMSRSGDPTSFFPRSMLSVRDDDPIDVALAFPKSSALRFAIPFNRSLILIADRAQYVLGGDGALSPKTVRVEPLTEFDASDIAKPAVMGPNVYFVQAGPEVSTVRELYIGADSLVNDAVDVTAHCPSFVPSLIGEIKASSLNDMVLFRKWIGPTDLWVFRTKWDKDRRLQQAWFRWNLGTGSILGMEFFGPNLFLVVSRPEGLFVENINFSLQVEPTPLGYGVIPTETSERAKVHLDRLFAVSGGDYDPITDTTTIPIAPFAVTQPLEVVSYQASDAGERREVVGRPSTTQVVIKGPPLLPGGWYIGVPYTATYTMSRQFVRGAEGVPRLNGRLQLRRMRVCLADSAYLRVDVTPAGRPTKSRVWNSVQRNNPPGPIRVENAEVDVAIQSDASTVKIQIINDSPYPSRVHAIEWTGYYHNRNRNE